MPGSNEYLLTFSSSCASSRQGPHQVAKKSTTIGLSLLAIIASSSSAFTCLMLAAVACTQSNFKSIYRCDERTCRCCMNSALPAHTVDWHRLSRPCSWGVWSIALQYQHMHLTTSRESERSANAAPHTRAIQFRRDETTTGRGTRLLLGSA